MEYSVLHREENVSASKELCKSYRAFARKQGVKQPARVPFWCFDEDRQFIAATMPQVTSVLLEWANEEGYLIRELVSPSSGYHVGFDRHVFGTTPENIQEGVVPDLFLNDPIIEDNVFRSGDESLFTYETKSKGKSDRVTFYTRCAFMNVAFKDYDGCAVRVILYNTDVGVSIFDSTLVRPIWDGLLRDMVSEST